MLIFQVGEALLTSLISFLKESLVLDLPFLRILAIDSHLEPTIVGSKALKHHYQCLQDQVKSKVCNSSQLL